ncbi:MAG: hypothetical protein ACI9EF_004004 [Pseudohongiellaceae bacterium]|jgi:hypothetical protein
MSDSSQTPDATGEAGQRPHRRTALAARSVFLGLALIGVSYAVSGLTSLFRFEAPGADAGPTFTAINIGHSLAFVGVVVAALDPSTAHPNRVGMVGFGVLVLGVWYISKAYLSF